MHQVGEEEEQLHEGNVMTWTPPFSGTKAEKSFVFGYKFAITVQPMFRPEFLGFLPEFSITVDFVKVGEDEGALGHVVSVDGCVSGRAVHDPNGMNVG